MGFKYLIVPGDVYSKDGDVHYISANQLMRLYGVSPAECIISSPHLRSRGRLKHLEKGLITLRPRSDGNYKSIGKEYEFS